MMRRSSRPKPCITVDLEGPLTPELARVVRCYNGSDADATRALYSDLITTRYPLGTIAVNLLRCEKNSIRAKVYRGSGNVSAAYDTKNWAMGELCRVLVGHADRYGIVWGWQTDPEQEYHSMVLYVELPGYGQASFHSKSRYDGPDFPKEWDGVRGKSAERIVRFAGDVLAGMFL